MENKTLNYEQQAIEIKDVVVKSQVLVNANSKYIIPRPKAQFINITNSTMLMTVTTSETELEF